MYEIKCGEVWGGVRGTDVDAITSGIEACLFCSVCDGGKGGDIYYFSVCENDLLTRIAIADVMGHGKAVSDTSEWLYNSLRDRMNTLDGNEVLSDLNRLAVQHGYKALTTAAVATVSRETSDLFFSYAGHHPLLIRHKASGEWTSLELPKSTQAANLPLGVDEAHPYEQSKYALRPGDLIFLYTDGVIEAPNPAGEFFDEERLMAALRSSGGDPRELRIAVQEALNRHVVGDLAHDDVTFMAITVR
jgi:sigma-B regulation protein RsbU (phosphoserine phosphatase)